MPGWAREIAANTANYGKLYEAKLMGRRRLLKAIKKQGRIVFNQGGVGNASDAGDFTWQVPFAQQQFQWGQLENGITPTAINRFQRAGLSYVDAVMSDFMTKKEKLRNTGASALIDIFEAAAKMLNEDAYAQFSKELYTDSTATGKSTRPSGIETMMGINGTISLAATAVTQRSANAGDVVAYPSTTYAGLSTVLGNSGGSWSVDAASINNQWPAGHGDQQFDYFSPIIVNYTSTAWGGASATWQYNAEKATRFLATHMGKYSNTDGSDALAMIMLDRELYRQLLDLYAGKERTMIVDSTKLRALGFGGITFDGVEVTWELDVPGAVGYGFDVDNMEIRSCQDTLFDVEGPWYEKIQKAYVTSLDFCGQLKFTSPRFFGKLAAIA